MGTEKESLVLKQEWNQGADEVTKTRPRVRTSTARLVSLLSQVCMTQSAYNVDQAGLELREGPAWLSI